MKSLGTIVLILLFAVSDLRASQEVNKINELNVDLFVMRKGAKVLITLVSNESKLPNLITIERKTTTALSVYRKVLTIEGDILTSLKEDGQLLLSDKYPESRHLDTYYRISYTADDSSRLHLPAIFLEGASSNKNGIFGDHKKDESLFENEEEMGVKSYEEKNIKFEINREKSKVVMLLAVKNNDLKGEFIIERKSAKPLSTFRKIKTIQNEDKEAVLKGEKEFIDQYPESAQLDSYYRFVVLDEQGNKTIFPTLFLEGQGPH